MANKVKKVRCGKGDIKPFLFEGGHQSVVLLGGTATKVSSALVAGLKYAW